MKPRLAREGEKTRGASGDYESGEGYENGEFVLSALFRAIYMTLTIGQNRLKFRFKRDL